ncbi:hypothetical protein ACTMU2_29805 [Cupriavidus basilensis]
MLAAAVIVDSIEAALEGATADHRHDRAAAQFDPPRLLPRDAAARGAASLAAREGTRSFVFGNERYGLPNEVVLRCAAVTHIPANPAYTSAQPCPGGAAHRLRDAPRASGPRAGCAGRQCQYRLCW